MKPEMFWKAALQQLKDDKDRANALTAPQRSYGEWEPKSVVVPSVNTSWSRPLTRDDREFLHSICAKADA